MSYDSDFEVAARLAHRRPLKGLAEKVAPRHTALIVIDMQNDFCADEGLLASEGFDVSEAQAVAERLPGLIDTARDAGVMIIFVRCVYSTQTNVYLSDVWLEQAARKRKGGYTRIPVCVEGEWSGDYYGEVRPKEGDTVVTKHRFNAFHNTDLDLILRSNGIRTMVMTGAVTNVCVESTARDGFMRDYYIVAVDDACAAYEEADHRQTMRNIDRFFGEVSDIRQLCALWGRPAAAAAAE